MTDGAMEEYLISLLFLSTEFSPIHLIHPGKWPGSTGSHWKHDYGKV